MDPSVLVVGMRDGSFLFLFQIGILKQFVAGYASLEEHLAARIVNASTQHDIGESYQRVVEHFARHDEQRRRVLA